MSITSIAGAIASVFMFTVVVSFVVVAVYGVYIAFLERLLSKWRSKRR